MPTNVYQDGITRAFRDYMAAFRDYGTFLPANMINRLLSVPYQLTSIDDQDETGLSYSAVTYAMNAIAGINRPVGLFMLVNRPLDGAEFPRVSVILVNDRWLFAKCDVDENAMMVLEPLIDILKTSGHLALLIHLEFDVNAHGFQQLCTYTNQVYGITPIISHES